ncbi:MAG: ABC transporter substrate-binding protein [Lachnospiraceae bacterium]|nr:ABC transporter substrate-binding protein [Lachnospiraceae bacterium]
MKNKKVVALLLAATMSVGCLAGCGNQTTQSSEVKTQTDSQKESETTVTESSEVVELEEKTIQIWLAGPGKQKDSDKVWEAFNEKLQEYVPNTTVEFTILPFGEYYDNYSRMLAAGEAVDLAWVGWNTKTQDNINDGNLMPMDELLEEYGQGILETLGEDVIDLHRNAADGKTYFVISWQGLVGQKYVYYMPTELVELAGDGWLEDTQTAVTKWWSETASADNFNAVFDQFDKYFAACKDAGKLYSGIRPNYDFAAWNGRNGTTPYVSGVNNVGVARTSENEFVVIDHVQSESRRVFAQRMAEFFEKGYLRSDIASVDLSTLKFVENGEYNANTVIMYSGNAATPTAQNNLENKAGVELSFIEREEVATLVNGNSTAMSVPYCADEPERAIMVLNALYTEPELYQLLIYGIEGEHYTVNNDGIITTSYGAEGTADADYGLTRWTVGTCMNSLVTQADNPGYYQELADAEAEAYVNPFVKFSFDKSNVTDVIAALDAVDSVYSKMVDLCAAGADMEATLDKWIAERKAAGVDKLIEEYQRQLNEYIKANNITSW